MAKDAVYQIRMDADIKDQVEQLYLQMGSTFAEAVRIFAVQSLYEQGMPFRPTVNRGKAFGIASKHANPDLMSTEKDAFARAMVEKHAID